MRKLFIFVLFSCTIGLQAQVNQFDNDTVRNSKAIEILISNDGVVVDTVTVLRSDVNAYQVHLDTDSLSTAAIEYTDTYWDDLRVPLQNTKLTPSKSEPNFEQISATGLYAYAFDNANDDDESLHFAAQIPHAWKIGTDLEFHVHWYPSSTNTGNVVFELDYIPVGLNGTMGSVRTMTATVAADGTAWKHQVDDIGTVDATGLTISSMIICRFTRLGDDAADTFTGNVFTNEVDFHYMIDAPGSPHEYVK